MLHGTLLKQNDKWVVVEKDDYWLTHPDHNLWLLIFGVENTKVCFTIDYNEYAILKSCYPDTHEYIQD